MNTRELDQILPVLPEWDKVPSVIRKGKYFYYGRSNGMAYRVIQDFLTDRWFLHITTV